MASKVSSTENPQLKTPMSSDESAHVTITTNADSTPSPILFIDTETTGLSANNNALISLSAIFLGGEFSGDYITIRCRPHVGSDIQPAALQCNGYTVSQIMKWEDPATATVKFANWVSERLGTGELARPAGWNFSFDDKFLREWLRRNGDQAFYGNTFTYHYDVMQAFKIFYPQYKSDTRFGNAKLTTAYRGIFGDDLQGAHTEFADCFATLKVFLHIAENAGSAALKPYIPCKLPTL